MSIFRRKKRNTDPESEAQEYNRRQEKYDDELKKIEQKTTFKTKLSRLKFPTYTKNLVAIITLICLIDLQVTYVLAFMDKVQIAEELSKQLCTTILGVAFVYMVRAYFDSKAEHQNDKPITTDDKKLKKELDNLVNSKISSIMQDLAAGTGIETPLNDLINHVSGDNESDNDSDDLPVNDEIPDEIGWREEYSEEIGVDVETLNLDPNSIDITRPLDENRVIVSSVTSTSNDETN